MPRPRELSLRGSATGSTLGRAGLSPSASQTAAASDVLRGFRPREYALPHRSRVGLGPLRAPSPAYASAVGRCTGSPGVTVLMGP
jgi:hypothetical protein